ncbi:hypothetical protein V2J09_021557 [Rumex salicifolius]
MRLIKNEIILQLDFSDLDVCIDCIKGKETKHIVKKPVMRSTQLLGVVKSTRVYGYTYLLHEKYQSINVLEVFIIEVERQLDRRVKVVRSNEGEIQVEVPLPVVALKVVVLISNDIMEQPNYVQIPQVESFVDEPVTIQEENSVQQESLRRSIRERRSTIPDDYVFILLKVNVN